MKSISALALMLALTSAVSAQSRTVPEELVIGLLGGRGGVANIEIGTLPQGFPADLRLPAGARVAGGMSTARASATAVVVVPDDAANVRAVMESQLAQDGWGTRQSRSASIGFQRPGFQPGASERPGAGAFCKAGANLQVTAIPHESNVTLLRLDFVAPSPSRANCDMPAVGATAFLPRFTSPEGTRMERSGTGGSDDGAEAHATLDSPLSAAELLAHYGAQLQEAGWIAKAAGGSTDTRVQDWTTTRDGIRWFGTLSVTAVPNSRMRQITFNMIPQ